MTLLCLGHENCRRDTWQHVGWVLEPGTSFLLLFILLFLFIESGRREGEREGERLDRFMKRRRR